MTASTLAPADARAVLDQLAAGALNVLPAAARDTLRAEAERALHALVLAQVVEVHPASRRGGRTVVIDCPHCRKRHVHGFPFGDAAPGWRNAHCGRGRRSYFIPAPSGLEPGGAPGRGVNRAATQRNPTELALTSPDAVAGGHQKGCTAMTPRSQPPDVQVLGPAVIVQGQAVPDLIYVLGLIINARREPPRRHQRFEQLRADLLRAYAFEPQPSAVRHCDVAVRRARAGSNLQPGEVTVADAERLTGLGRRQIQRLARDGIGRRVGARWAVNIAGLHAHVATQRDRRQREDTDAA